MVMAMAGGTFPPSLLVWCARGSKNGKRHEGSCNISMRVLVSSYMWRIQVCVMPDGSTGMRSMQARHPCVLFIATTLGCLHQITFSRSGYVCHISFASSATAPVADLECSYKDAL